MRTAWTKACQRVAYSTVIGSSGIAAVTAMLAPRYRRRLPDETMARGGKERAGTSNPSKRGVTMSKLLSVLIAAVFAVSTVSVFAADAAAPAGKKEETKKEMKKEPKAPKVKKEKKEKKELKKEEKK
jgi:hypothetical protein